MGAWWGYGGVSQMDGLCSCPSETILICMGKQSDNLELNEGPLTAIVHCATPQIISLVRLELIFPLNRLWKSFPSLKRVEIQNH